MYRHKIPEEEEEQSFEVFEDEDLNPLEDLKVYVKNLRANVSRTNHVMRELRKASHRSGRPLTNNFKLQNDLKTRLTKEIEETKKVIKRQISERQKELKDNLDRLYEIINTLKDQIALSNDENDINRWKNQIMYLTRMIKNFEMERNIFESERQLKRQRRH